MRRREWLKTPLLMVPVGAAAADGEPVALLRAGGAIAAFRHALAPGTFDPPGFRLDECSTQRNLNDEGRAQARRLGEWFRAQGLRPGAVRSSPWCRCLETARLAFGRVEPWDALSSPRSAGIEEGAGASSAPREPRLQALRDALRQRRSRPGFDTWVTHQFVLSDLVGGNIGSGEGLVLRAGEGGRVELLARIVIA